MLCLVKSIFFFYNNGTNSVHSFRDILKILCWSLYYDLVAVSIATIPFFFCSLLPANKSLLLAGSIVASVLAVLLAGLNIADIFYFPFHRQRADADLLYVMRDPVSYGGYKALLIITLVIIFCVAGGLYFFKQFKKLSLIRLTGSAFYSSFFITLLMIASLFMGRSKRMIPSRPLTEVTAAQLAFTQNSLHTFLYSVYRSNESVIPSKNYMTAAQSHQLFTIDKKNTIVSANKKNVVLFIMESVPYDFFDTTSRFKTTLPFLDSLLDHSTYYSNAFSYSYNSNKGITAILTGIPTITDIPLYHSGFVSLPKVAVGKLLQQKGYSSSFFIGDNYDDFGFAKCCNWTGIQHYYCMEDIPGYKKMEKHSMGLHDEYVLNFMQQKLRTTAEPFFSAFYNISTHYPNDLPSAEKEKHYAAGTTNAMRSMMYYDACLAVFFKEAAQQKWFSNTVFIFCSDHWASPNSDNSRNDMVNSFRIPVLIYEPTDNSKRVNSQIVSQLDVMNTILSFSGSTPEDNNFTSYGISLREADSNRIVFTKKDNSIYQAISKNYVLGFNADEGKRLYCYRYSTDSSHSANILPGKNATADSLELYMKAFLQTAASHYKGKGN